MFIDYVTLMLINTAAGFLVLALFVHRGLGEHDQKHWASAFASVGLVALLNGFHMVWHWPLPGSYNSAYGELSALFGILMAGAALALALGWRLMPLAVYAFFAGFAALLLGVRFINLGLSNAPLLTGVGFGISGICGICAPILLWKPKREFRLLGAGTLVLASCIWALIGYGAYWAHMQSFMKWVPVMMR